MSSNEKEIHYMKKEEMVSIYDFFTKIDDFYTSEINVKVDTKIDENNSIIFEISFIKINLGETLKTITFTYEEVTTDIKKCLKTLEEIYKSMKIS